MALKAFFISKNSIIDRVLASRWADRRLCNLQSWRFVLRSLRKASCASSKSAWSSIKRSSRWLTISASSGFYGDYVGTAGWNPESQTEEERQRVLRHLSGLHHHHPKRTGMAAAQTKTGPTTYGVDPKHLW